MIYQIIVFLQSAYNYSTYPNGVFIAVDKRTKWHSSRGSIRCISDRYKPLAVKCLQETRSVYFHSLKHVNVPTRGKGQAWCSWFGAFVVGKCASIMAVTVYPPIKALQFFCDVRALATEDLVHPQSLSSPGDSIHYIPGTFGPSAGSCLSRERVCQFAVNLL